MENYINKIIHGDCIEVMNAMPEGIIDLIVTSPPYNCGIDYDTHDDFKSMEDYWEFTESWLKAGLRLLKDDGRIAVNVPYEINVKERGGRVMFMAEFWSIMKKVGYKPFGMVDLDEETPHRVKLTAWGSWMSASGPYIYNPKECIILGYKKNHIKLKKGESQWISTKDESEDGTPKIKYTEEDKKEFKDLVFGQWKYFADTRTLTKASFSMDIPLKAIKILTYKNDIVLDPFNGSGTSCVAAEILERNWIGIELSENYCKVARERIQPFVEKKKQTVLDLKPSVYL